MEGWQAEWGNSYHSAKWRSRRKCTFDGSGNSVTSVPQVSDAVLPGAMPRQERVVQICTRCNEVKSKEEYTWRQWRSGHREVF